MTFGQICIHPDYQRKGYGKILLDYSLEKAKNLGAKCILIEGNINFYGKSGFIKASEKGIKYADYNGDDDAPFFLCKELEKDFLKDIKGIYKDPEGYFVADKYPELFEEFDNKFPKKEKLKLPGQLFDN